RHHAGLGPDFDVRADGAGCHSFGVGVFVDSSTNAAAVHQLGDDTAALGVHRFGNTPPALDLLLGVQPRGAAVALAVLTWLSPLGDDQSSTGALAVIFRVEFGRCITSACATAGHGRH